MNTVSKLFRKPRELTRSDFIMLLAIAAVVGLVGTIVGRNLSAVEALWNGGLDFGDGLGRFPLSLQERILAGFLFLAIFVAALCLQYQLSGIQNRYATDKGRAERAHAQMERLEERLEGATRALLAEMRTALSDISRQLDNAKMQNEITQNSQRLHRVEEYTLQSGQFVLSGELEENIGTVRTRTTELHVYDPETHKKALRMVVHIFDDVAYWEFQDTNSFVGSDGEPEANLWRNLSSDAAITTFAKYDIVAGLGLESKTRGGHGSYSTGRAQTLCTSLNNIFGNRIATKAYGLDIGKYRGAAGESKDKRNHKLRPVVLIGISAPESTKYREFLTELLASVELLGLDLGNFEKLRRGHRPDWVPPPECIPEHEFMLDEP